MVEIARAREKIAFEPQVSLEQGIADTVRWYAEART
jgi:nucleoside-diphosphate-sugar epimerase